MHNPNKETSQSPNTAKEDPHECVNRVERPICPEDPYKKIKHADSYGRVNLGRKFAFKTFAVQEMTEGAILLRPVAIVERRQLRDHDDEIIRSPTVSKTGVRGMVWQRNHFRPAASQDRCRP